jgi:L-cysteine S-thiosulfotransferase
MAACFSCDAHASEAGLLAYDIVGDAVPAALGGLLGDPERGREIVLDRRSGNCLICHALPAIDQHFQGELGPALAGVGERLSTGQIRLRLIDQSRINATTIMPPYYRVDALSHVAPEYIGQTALQAQQIEDVVAYLSTLSSSP